MKQPFLLDPQLFFLSHRAERAPGGVGSWTCRPVSDLEISQSTNVQIPAILKIGLCVLVGFFFLFLSFKLLEIRQRDEEVRVLNWFVFFYRGSMVLF